MEFKFRAIDNNVPPPTTSHSPSPVTYLPDQSLQRDAGFSGFGMQLSNEAALRREIEKEQIRREIRRRIELEEEVRRELAMEKELGISIHRPLMTIPGLMSHWSNSAVMNPAAAVAHIDASQPPSILPTAEINPLPEISDDKDKVIVLDKPDPDLFNAKRKATAPPDSEIEPPAFSLKKKPKEQWSCALCEIKATSESGLNAHLNGKKHKAREAGQNRKIARNKKSEKNVKAVETVVTTTNSVVDAEKDQQLLQPCTSLEVMNETAADKGVEESTKEEQLVKTVAVADNDASATESKNEKFVEMMVGKNITELENEEQLAETIADNSVMWKVKPINENDIVEMMVNNDVIKFENGGLLVEKSQNVGSFESKKDVVMEEAEKISVSKNDAATMEEAEKISVSKKDAAMEEAGKISVSKKDAAMEEVEKISVSNKDAAMEEAEKISVSNKDAAMEEAEKISVSKNDAAMEEAEKISVSKNDAAMEEAEKISVSKKDAAMEEAEKISALTKKTKVEPLWCEICQINTFSKAVMEGHVKGKKHIKKMKKFGQNNASPPSSSSVSQKAPSLIKDAETVNKETG
ncbi:uncharacterized protein LOC131600271 [Vicia villosa]|uniref:uncharacterized protein LOC131600271 n=1 Tax=Vicia villosa TaxID=3911 RepID=UPI00273C1A3B|nr:uncharacterized protein LOC131600271 [Vicia villosa]